MKLYTLGWNTTSYLGQYDSNFDYLILRDFQTEVIMGYFNFELNFNLLLIDPDMNNELNLQNIKDHIKLALCRSTWVF